MIHSLYIKNWKGHDELSISFRKGVNFITGPNGIGKTSILDAICFAFLGTLEFMGSYRGITYKNLIRDIDKDSEIRLSFSLPEDKGYEVIRKINGRRTAEIKENGKALETRWKEVTNRILDIYNAPEFFFNRCVFLSEGDTYEYINRPPGEALATHIEGVLGIIRMENVESIFERLSRKHHEGSNMLRSDIESALLLSEKDEYRIKEIDREKVSLEEKKAKIIKEISEMNKERNNLLIQIERLNKAIEEVSNIMIAWKKYFANFDLKTKPIEVVKDVRNRIDSEYIKISNEKANISKEIGGISALIDSMNKILDIIKPLSEGISFDVVCPVCKRPLTEHMVEEIEKESSEHIESLQSELMILKEKSNKNAKDERLSREKADILIEIESKIKNLIEKEPKTISEVEIGEKIKAIKDKIDGINREIDNVSGIVNQVEKDLISTEMEQKGIKEKTEPGKIDDKKKLLLSSTKIEIITQAFSEALSDSLAEQRKIMLTPLTQELSKMWSRFLGRSVKVEMGDKFEIIIMDEENGRLFKFPQLSGGEKTALLILTQILLCKHFSDSDFMLIDEPLEHLDSRNSWSLINFLVESCKRDFPKQLIVTTIEEPFLREYLENPIVNINSLG